MVRVQVSNAFGVSDLPITAATVALAALVANNATDPAAGGNATGAAWGAPGPDGTGASAVNPDTIRLLTFSGSANFTVPAGAVVYSDPVKLPLPLPALSEPGNGTGAGDSIVISVTLFLSTGQTTRSVTGHPGSRTTSYLAPGNQLTTADLAAVPGSAKTDHWYLIATVEGWFPEQGAKAPAALMIVGDSLSDGRGSTTNGNDRWPDALQARLKAAAAGGAGSSNSSSGASGSNPVLAPGPAVANGTLPPIAVINVAAGGNRLLYDGLGPSVLARLDRDVVSHGPSAAWALVLVGINDIGTCATDATQQASMGQRILLGFDQMVTRLHARGIAALGGTLTPFGGADEGQAGYDHPNREATRRRVNDWIRTSKRFDAVVDFDRVVRDEDVELAIKNGSMAVSGRLKKQFDAGDHLHLNPEGYRVMAAAVDLADLERLKDGVVGLMT